MAGFARKAHGRLKQTKETGVAGDSVGSGGVVWLRVDESLKNSYCLLNGDIAHWFGEVAKMTDFEEKQLACSLIEVAGSLVGFVVF